jgi:hypothetical protein
MYLIMVCSRVSWEIMSRIVEAALSQQIVMQSRESMTSDMLILTPTILLVTMVKDRVLFVWH